MESESDPLTSRPIDLFEKEPLKGKWEVNLHTPTKFGEDPSKDLRVHREQTNAYSNYSMIQLAVLKYAPLFSGCHLSIHTDNTAACHMINKGYSSNRAAAAILREVAVCALRFDCTVSAHYIPGVINHIPDATSRLHQRGQWQRLNSLLYSRFPLSSPPCEMTPLSYTFLLQLWSKGLNNWT